MSKALLHRLRNLHRDLDFRIAKEQRLASFDAERLSELKRLKLSIKDRIAEIETGAPH